MFDYKEAKAYWWLFLVSGLLSILIGGALVLWPGKTLTVVGFLIGFWICLLYTSPSPRDGLLSRMPSSA